MKHGMHAVMSGIAASLLVFTVAGPALAAGIVEKRGATSCYYPNSNSFTDAKTTGDTDVKGPGGTTFTRFYNGGIWHVRTVAGKYGGGAWHVKTIGELSNAGTYGFCNGAV